MSEIRPGMRVTILDRDIKKDKSVEAPINKKQKKTEKVFDFFFEFELKSIFYSMTPILISHKHLHQTRKIIVRKWK